MTHETISKLKALLITDVADKLGLVVRKKRALCFNHDDHNPSLTFDEKKGTFRCYVCDIKGDTLSLVQKRLGLPFLDSCYWLIQQFQILVNEPEQKTNFKYKKPLPKVKVRPEKTVSRHQPNANIYEWVIKKLSLSSSVESYLTNERGFSKERIKELEIRDLQRPGPFFTELVEEWGANALIDCGLLKIVNDQVKNIWWDHVLIFPFIDLNLRIVYLQARRMHAEPGKSKYLALSQLKPAIYNINILTQLSEGEDLFICEGIPDTITALELNMPAIGVLGVNSFDEEIVDLLLQYNIKIVPDSDPAGQLFVQKVRKAFYRRGKTVQEQNIPKPYKDLNEYFISKNSRTQ